MNVPREQLTAMQITAITPRQNKFSNTSFQLLVYLSLSTFSVILCWQYSQNDCGMRNEKMIITACRLAISLKDTFSTYYKQVEKIINCTRISTKRPANIVRDGPKIRSLAFLTLNPYSISSSQISYCIFDISGIILYQPIPYDS